jgi:hypothetical protein
MVFPLRPMAFSSRTPRILQPLWTATVENIDAPIFDD